MLRHFSRQNVARYISTLKLVDKGLKKFKDSKNVSYFCNYCIIKIINEVKSFGIRFLNRRFNNSVSDALDFDGYVGWSLELCQV